MADHQTSPSLHTHPQDQGQAEDSMLLKAGRLPIDDISTEEEIEQDKLQLKNFYDDRQKDEMEILDKFYEDIKPVGRHHRKHGGHATSGDDDEEEDGDEEKDKHGDDAGGDDDGGDDDGVNKVMSPIEKDLDTAKHGEELISIEHSGDTKHDFTQKQKHSDESENVEVPNDSNIKPASKDSVIASKPAKNDESETEIGNYLDFEKAKHTIDKDKWKLKGDASGESYDSDPPPNEDDVNISDFNTISKEDGSSKFDEFADNINESRSTKTKPPKESNNSRKEIHYTNSATNKKVAASYEHERPISVSGKNAKGVSDDGDNYEEMLANLNGQIKDLKSMKSSKPPFKVSKQSFRRRQPGPGHAVDNKTKKEAAKLGSEEEDNDQMVNVTGEVLDDGVLDKMAEAASGHGHHGNRTVFTLRDTGSDDVVLPANNTTWLQRIHGHRAIIATGCVVGGIGLLLIISSLIYVIINRRREKAAAKRYERKRSYRHLGSDQEKQSLKEANNNYSLFPISSTDDDEGDEDESTEEDDRYFLH